MKQTIKTSRTAGYLEKIFRALNEHYFEGQIEEPVITIQSTPRAYGHVTVAKDWQRADGGARHELNIGAGTLDRPIENVTATVLHEMVHLFNLQVGIQDTSRGNTYHNKRFKEEAEKRGLLIDYDPKIGHSITQPAPALKSFCTAQRWRNKLTIARTLDLPDDTPRQKKPSSTRKYACPCCGQSVRATKEVRILCMECAQQMEVAS